MQTDLGDKPTQRYGFYGRLKEDFPSQIIVDATEVCNLACIHCAHAQFEKSEYYEASHLDPVLNKKMVDEVRDHGSGICGYIRYASSGEPLLHPHIDEMIEYACWNSGTMISLTTNGTLLTKRRIERLLKAGVDVIDVSIDAFTPETYARVRVKGNLHVTRANVINLIELSRAKSSRTKVVVSFIEQPENRQEVEDFESFWKDKGADYVIVRRLHSNAGASGGVAERMRNENAGRSRRPCLYPWERIVLSARGWLSFCPADWSHGGSFVDYRSTTIRETWSGEFYRKLRAAHLNQDYSDFPFCGQCPDWAATRWPDEGRSFADMIEDFQRGKEHG